MNIQGTSGSDTLVGTNFPDIIYGLAGDDILLGGGGDDLLFGGLGDDTLNGGGSDDTAAFHWQDYFSFDDGDAFFAYFIDASANVVGRLTDNGGSMRIRGIQNDYFGSGETSIDFRHNLSNIENLSTGFGDDRLYGNDDNNVLSSGSGDDFLSGGRGKDSLYGSSGDDTLAGGGGTDHLDGGDGFDIADYSENTSKISADLSQGRVGFPGHKWSPELLVSIEGVIAGSGNDLLLGTGQGDYLAGSKGNDTLRGFGGDDTLDGGYGRDLIQGGGGSDTADYSSVSHDVRIRIGAQQGEIYKHNGTRQSTDTFQSIENGTGGSGDDTLLGNVGANVFDGGDGNDLIDSREGNDTIFLSSGNDHIDGGTGIDTLVIDHTDAVLGVATYDLSGGYSNTYATFKSSYEADSYVDLIAQSARGGGAFTGNSSVQRIENVDIRAGFGDDTVIGSDAENEIHVGSGANFVRGGSGNDLIYGGFDNLEDYLPKDGEVSPGGITEWVNTDSSDNRLFGEGGNDTLHGSGHLDGGSGDDRLVCETFDHAVTMTGGSGADDFVFSGEIEIYSGWHVTQGVMSGRIADFDHDEGDRVIVDGNISEIFGDDVPLTYVGETDSISSNEYGFFRDSDDTIIQYGNAYYEPYEKILTITLEGYSGPLSQDDIVFA